ncbi:hypothetical protein M569_05034 [Genlisea aurea]|uniref:Uncharacterized protein n=1 Tax=Genlisea aurea TaxID=192259 RepID=S8CR68_9LAMI|nr:hypothetical protein M569_05034 [Genlisea aurea]
MPVYDESNDASPSVPASKMKLPVKRKNQGSSNDDLKHAEVARIIESMIIPGVDDDTLLKATEAIMANENKTILFLDTSEARRVRMILDIANKL